MTVFDVWKQPEVTFCNEREAIGEPKTKRLGPTEKPKTQNNKQERKDERKMYTCHNCYANDAVL